MSRLNLAETVWFFDVDDTLINTEDQTGPASDGVYQELKSAIGDEAARRVQAEYVGLFSTMMEAHRLPPEPAGLENELRQREEAILKRIALSQKMVLQNHGFIKKWSREVLIKLAADTNGIHLDAALVEKAANGYWHRIQEGLAIFDGSLELVRALRSKGAAVFLMTSSDARLEMRPDGFFVYDPIHSEWLKKKRLAPLRAKGVEYSDIIVGDPVDKPQPAFFKKCMAVAERTLGRPVRADHCVAIGDSYKTDIKIPVEELGFNRGILLERRGPTNQPQHQSVQTVRDLKEILLRLE